MKKREDWGEAACLPAQSTSEFDKHLVRQHLWELSLASRGVICSDNGNKRKRKDNDSVTGFYLANLRMFHCICK